MRFDSLSDAIKYYTSDVSETFRSIAPYSELASQANVIAPTLNYLPQPTVNAMTYGVTIWGQSNIINISKPQT